MYTTANDADGPYFVFATPSPALGNVSFAAGNGITSFLNRYLTVPRISNRDQFLRDAVDIRGDPLILALSLLIIILLSEALTFSLLLSAPHGTASPLSVSMYRFVQNVRHFRFNRLVSRNSKNDSSDQARQKSKKRVWILGAIVVTTLLGFQFVVIAFSHRSVYRVLNSERAFEIVQPIDPDWGTVWSASSKLVNQPCVVLIITNAGGTFTRINNCVTSNLSANHFEPYEPVQSDTALSASIVSELHAYGADHILTIDGESAEFVARSYFSLDDRQERVMRQRSGVDNSDRQMVVLHQQFFAYLFSSYVRTTGDLSLSLELLQELKVNVTPSRNGSMMGITQTDGGTDVFQVSSIRYETKFTGAMPRGTAALRFGQAFFKGMIGVKVVSNDVRDLIAGTGVSTAEALVWNEWRRRLNWLVLLVIIGVLGLMVLLVRILLNPANEMEITPDGPERSPGSALLMEATEDDGEREFYERSMRMRSLGTGVDEDGYLTTADEYPVNGSGDFKSEIS